MKPLSGHGIDKTSGIAEHGPAFSRECRVLERGAAEIGQDVRVKRRVPVVQTFFPYKYFEKISKVGGSLRFQLAANARRIVIRARKEPEVALEIRQKTYRGNPA